MELCCVMSRPIVAELSDVRATSYTSSPHILTTFEHTLISPPPEHLVAPWQRSRTVQYGRGAAQDQRARSRPIDVDTNVACRLAFARPFSSSSASRFTWPIIQAHDPRPIA